MEVVYLATTCCAYILFKMPVQRNVGWHKARCGLPVSSSPPLWMKMGQMPLNWRPRLGSGNRVNRAWRGFSDVSPSYTVNPFEWKWANMWMLQHMILAQMFCHQAWSGTRMILHRAICKWTKSAVYNCLFLSIIFWSTMFLWLGFRI